MTTQPDCIALDDQDPLRPLRNHFNIPTGTIYLDGNSLGVMPAATPAQDLRGFDQRTGADGSIYTSITGEFKGWSKSGERFRLDNGQVWQITDTTSRLKVSMVNPDIIIEPGALGAWYMKVVGYNTRARVKRIK